METPPGQLEGNGVSYRYNTWERVGENRAAELTIIWLYVYTLLFWLFLTASRRNSSWSSWLVHRAEPRTPSCAVNGPATG